MMCPYLIANPGQASAGIQTFEVKLGKGVADRQLTDETAEFAVTGEGVSVDESERRRW